MKSLLGAHSRTRGQGVGLPQEGEALFHLDHNKCAISEEKVPVLSPGGCSGQLPRKLVVK